MRLLALARMCRYPAGDIGMKRFCDEALKLVAILERLNFAAPIQLIQKRPAAAQDLTRHARRNGKRLHGLIAAPCVWYVVCEVFGHRALLQVSLAAGLRPRQHLVRSGLRAACWESSARSGCRRGRLHTPATQGRQNLFGLRSARAPLREGSPPVWDAVLINPQIKAVKDE